MNPALLPTQKVETTYQAGQIIAGKYRLTYPAAAGGMGVVWAARHVSLDVPVALKFIHERHTEDEDNRRALSERLRREAHATAKLSHAAIVKVTDFGFTDGDDPYIAMELLEGEALGALLDREIRLAPERALAVMLPVAEGLCAAHAEGIVHRDLKPDNIFLAKESDGRTQPKLVDFGIAKLTRIDGQSKMTGTAMLGTPDYMAPEQIYAVDEVDERSDVWAFCVVLYEMLAGSVPFFVKTLPEVYYAICTRTPPSLAASMGLDGDLWAILERGLAKDPRARWQSMRDLGDQLAGWLAAQGIEEDVTGALLCTRWSVARSRTPVPPPPRPPPPRPPPPSAKPANDTVEVKVEWTEDEPPRPSLDSAAPQVLTRAPLDAGKRAGHRARPIGRMVLTVASLATAAAWFLGVRLPVSTADLADVRKSAMPAMVSAQTIFQQAIVQGEAAGQAIPKSLDELFGGTATGKAPETAPHVISDAGSD